MKIRSVVTGDVVEIEDEGARILIDAKIYEAVDETDKKPKAAQHPKRRRPR